MKVYTEDISRLFDQAIRQFEQISEKNLGDLKNAEFFMAMTNDINQKTHSNLHYETIYKQYFLRLKSYSSPEIGFSLNYLNAICAYVYNTDYTEKYKTLLSDVNEIPEFPYPPFVPCFPATPAVRINVPKFKDVWIKDESFNPTGTHKDRMAWEIYLFYDKYYKELSEKSERISLPRLSIISSGNAALSIQYLLKYHGLPNLKVIVDRNMDKSFRKTLEYSGCEVYPTNLTKRLGTDEILEITENKNGYDITYGDKIENIKLTFYDWLSYEILNLNPNGVFVPYGSGDLYRNIVEICISELRARHTSKRFFGNKNILSACNFFAGYTDDPNTSMKMLYSPHNTYDENDIKNLLESGVIGPKSKGYKIEEKYVGLANSLASRNKIECENSGIAGLALFLQMKNDLDPEKKYVIINTGKLKRELFVRDKNG